MNTIVKYVVGHTYKPLLEKYLSKKRVYRYNGFKLAIPPEVFHPGFFFSTRFLMKYLDQFQLKNKSILELGAGSGLIAMHAAKEGAMVTASDLNHTAIEYLGLNSQDNHIQLDIIESNLFSNIPKQEFDFILINPPFFKKDPESERDLAWYCGRKGEYFVNLFDELGDYMHANTEVLMVLCEDCDLQMIERMAHKNDFSWNCVSTKRNLAGWHYIYRFRKADHKDDPFMHFYLRLREKENRIYSDEELKQLPSIDPSHPHAAEWAIRERSAMELSVYLRLLRKPFDILEIGCGNGWLSNKLATIPRSRVMGIDVNELELEQARRVFGNSANLRFLHGDIRNGVLKNELFDVAVFAASIQYFDDLDEILLSAMQHLNPGGSIHIIDSCFYKTHEVASARKRSRTYFNKIGFPEMSAYYFHHSINEIKKYNYRVMYDQGHSFPQTEKRDRIFPWICIEENK